MLALLGNVGYRMSENGNNLIVPGIVSSSVRYMIMHGSKQLHTISMAMWWVSIIQEKRKQEWEW